MWKVNISIQPKEFGLSTELIMKIGNCEKFWEVKFQVFALHQSKYILLMPFYWCSATISLETYSLYFHSQPS